MKLSLTDKVLIRPAREGDLQGVLRVEYESFKDPYPLDLLRHLLASNPLSFLVSEVDGKIVGYIIGTVRWLNIGHILAIAVDPKYRRRGIGTMLMKAAMDYFGKRAVRKVRLEARESNVGARRFYSSLGFSEVGRVPYYYSDGETAIVFEREL